MVIAAGTRFDRYKVCSLLGKGGMGEVYLAQDTQLDRTVALKILSADLAADQQRMRRFIQEAKAASTIHHPNIAHVYEIGESDGMRFIAMEHIEGKPLDAEISGHPLDMARIINVGAQVADALDEAHSKGITHRDIKPSNIIVTPRGQAKVLDFGLAKVRATRSDIVASDLPTQIKTDSGLVMGTVEYMSPEQALGRDVDHRTDIFSLGVTLYEMATGKRPFTGATATETIDRIAHAQPEAIARFNYDVPAELERIVRKCLEKDQERRYQTARELEIDLQNLQRVRAAMTPGAEALARPKRRGFRPAHLIIAATILVLFGLGYYLFIRRDKTTGDAGGKNIESIAVLPLVNASNDPNMEYLSDGITENIINSLSQLRVLRVIPRTTVIRYKGQNIDPQKIGRELGVRAVLTGKVIQRDDTLVIQVDLVDITEGSQLWGGKYNRKFSDIFQAQDEIAKEIVEKLRLKLSGEQEKLLTKHYTENTEAYKLYLQGKYYGSKWTEEGWKKSLEYYNRAIDIDPNYALAYTGLADSYVRLGLFGAMPQKEAYPRAKAAALKALQLDDSLAEAHASLGFVKELYDWDFAGAKSAIKRAIEINPNNAGAHGLYGYHLIHMGQFDEAIAEMRRAVDLDPLSVENLASLADAYIYARQPDQAIEQCKRALEMDHNYSEAHFFLGPAFEQKGMYQEAIAEFQKAIELSGGSPEALSGLGHAYAVSGKRDKARQVIDELKQLSTRRYIDPALIAVIYAGLGEKDEAFRWLEKAYEDRSSWLVHAKAEPGFDPLRSDLRFTDLLRRVGLTP
jgi:serine/threonine-protein kinase